MLFFIKIIRLVIFITCFTVFPILTNSDEVTSIGTLDQDALYRNSLFGQRVFQEVSNRSEVLLAQELALQSQLETEERSLTVKRKKINIDEFKKLAADFDEKVQKIRLEITEARISLNNYSESERNRFFKIVIPTLVQVSEEFGLSTLLDHRMVIISLSDITDVAVKRVDKAIGDGMELTGD